MHLAGIDFCKDQYLIFWVLISMSFNSPVISVINVGSCLIQNYNPKSKMENPFLNATFCQNDVKRGN